MTRSQNFKEIFIVFAVMTGVFLPVRIIFVTYVNDNWLGSFGLISGLSILILVLTKKQKLGFFGKMFERQMTRLHSSRFSKLIYFQVVFLLIVFGSLVFSIEMGNSFYFVEKQQLLEQTTHISDYGLELNSEIEMTLESIVLGVLLSVFAFIFEFPLFAGAVAVIDDVFDGWLLHIYTVAFVEQLEVFGILLFFRFAMKKDLDFSQIGLKIKKFLGVKT